MRHTAIVFGATLFLAGCAFPDEALHPSLTGADPAGGLARSTAAAQPQPVQGQAVRGTGAPPIFGATVFETPGVTIGAPSGTQAGQKIDDLRGDLRRLQGLLSAHNDQLQTTRGAARESAGAYHSLAVALNARLQAGTAPGGPEAVAQWHRAQVAINKVGESITSLNALSNESASTSALAAFLLESTRAAFEMRGTVEEDRRQLAVLEDEVGKTVVVVDRLLDELNEDIARAQNYYAAERSTLTAMQTAMGNGEYVGGSLAGRAHGVPAPPPAGGAATLVGQRQPLVVIRFNQPKVDYEQALFDVVSRALERRPNAAFDLVAVAPSAGSAAQVSLATGKSRRRAEGVLRSLTGMGLPADRLTLSATSSPSAQVNEVHLYVR